MWSGSILFEIQNIFSTMVTSMTFLVKDSWGKNNIQNEFFGRVKI